MNNSRLVDADTHLYEPPGLFESYVPRSQKELALGTVEVDGIRMWAVDGTPMPMLGLVIDETAPGPGAMDGLTRGMTEGAPPGPPVPFDPDLWTACVDRKARLAVMEDQGVDAAMVFPTICLALEHQLHERIDILNANVSAYNRYVQEHWGFGQDGKIFAAAWLSLVDGEAAVAELDWLVGHGVRLVNLRAGAIYGRSPADPVFDPVWALLEEAGVVVSFHGGDAGLQDAYTPTWGEKSGIGSFMWSPFQMAMAFVERAAADTLAALVLHNLFGRFPSLRVLSVENGAFWVPELLERMDRSAFIARGEGLGGPLDSKPSEIFREHVYLTPYERDDIPELVHLVGADRLLFGSDWPHPTGLANPAEFADRIEGLTASEMDLLMGGSARHLLNLDAS